MVFGCASFCVIRFIWKERRDKRIILRMTETLCHLDSLRNSSDRCIRSEIQNIVDDQYLVDTIFCNIFGYAPTIEPRIEQMHFGVLVNDKLRKGVCVGILEDEQLSLAASL